MEYDKITKFSIIAPLNISFRMELLEVIGKQNKTVPILMTDKIVIAIETLNKYRSTCGVPSDNKYVFASRGKGPIGAWNTMTMLAVEANCEHPELVTSTRCRKYIATVAQV